MHFSAFCGILQQLHLDTKKIKKNYVINFKPKIIEFKQLGPEPKNWRFYIKNVYFILCCV